MNKKQQAIINAAILWAYCPKEGGYKDGPSIEDLCEFLSEVVQEYTGIYEDDLPANWLTVKETLTALNPSITQDDIDSGRLLVRKRDNDGKIK